MYHRTTFPFELVERSEATTDQLTFKPQTLASRILEVSPGLEKFAEPFQELNFAGRTTFSELLLKDVDGTLHVGCHYQFIIGRTKYVGLHVGTDCSEGRIGGIAHIAVDFQETLETYEGESYELLKSWNQK